MASDLALHYRKDDRDATIVPDLFVVVEPDGVFAYVREATPAGPSVAA